MHQVGYFAKYQVRVPDPAVTTQLDKGEGSSAIQTALYILYTFSMIPSCLTVTSHFDHLYCCLVPLLHHTRLKHAIIVTMPKHAIAIEQWNQQM